MEFRVLFDVVQQVRDDLQLIQKFSKLCVVHPVALLRGLLPQDCGEVDGTGRGRCFGGDQKSSVAARWVADLVRRLWRLCPVAKMSSTPPQRRGEVKPGGSP
ncbi:hypothetical protein [Aldersonia sp. NBC_00410]|uniref:hypothetical protein n=1 Tax=Aldersonia sp. NBC_00410 TaxID=2975954 RepID=UPI002257400A|nr:hypothetical protein [Aldersonia sp. NBC_00410]